MTTYDPTQRYIDDEEWERWPRFFMRYRGDTFADGTFYIRCDNEQHSAAYTAANELIWEYFEGENPARYQSSRGCMFRASPIYLLRVQTEINRGYIPNEL